MSNSRVSKRGLAKVSLGLSLLFAVGIFVYLSLKGTPMNGVILGILIVISGIWGYRRRLQDEMTVEKYEAKAEKDRQRNRR